MLGCGWRGNHKYKLLRVLLRLSEVHFHEVFRIALEKDGWTITDARRFLVFLDTNHNLKVVQYEMGGGWFVSAVSRYLPIVPAYCYYKLPTF